MNQTNPSMVGALKGEFILLLHEQVKVMIQGYYDMVDLNFVNDAYHMVIKEMEYSLLKETVKIAQGNQSRASKWLGLSRGTLRRLLKQYNLEKFMCVDETSFNDSPLKQLISRIVKAYYSEQADLKNVKEVYKIFLVVVEQPLLQETLKFCRGNQSQAAQILGISRSLLRKKLEACHAVEVS